MAWTALKTPEIGGGLAGAGVGYNMDQDATTPEKMQNALIGATIGIGGGFGLRMGDKMSGGAVARALIPDKGLTEEWIAGRSRMMGGKKIIKEDFETLLKEVSQLDEKERKVLYGMLTNKSDKLDDTAISQSLKELSAKSRETVNKYAKELVDLGVIRDKTFIDNMDTYLHRTYDAPDAVAKSDIPSNINNIGDAALLRGKVVTLTGDERKAFLDGTFKPDELPGWEKVGETTEIRYKGDKEYSPKKELKVRRDWTKEERVQMREVTDAHKAILRTGNMLAEDVSRFRFFKEMAETEGISSAKRTGLLTEKLPDDIQFGALRGRYVDKATKADLEQIREINTLSKYKNNKWVKKYRKLNSYWKGSKTHANPAVHFNNGMSNIVHYDNANGTVKNFFAGLKNIFKRDEIYKEAEERGVFGGFFSSELSNEVSLVNLFTPSSGRMKTNLDLVDSYLNYSIKLGKKLKEFTWDKSATLYNYEDKVFRMGLYRSEKERLIRSGLDEKQAMDRAARMAREWFVDYSRSSPVLDFLREGPLPFVSYMYGVIPKLAETAAKRPIKFAKWGLLMGALNETGEILSDADSEKQQRRLQDSPMYGIPGMPKTKIKLPDAISPDTKDDWYFDIERMLPGGNLFEGSEGSGLGRIPGLPLSLQPSLGAAGSLLNTAMGVDIPGFPSFSGDKLTRALSGEYSPTKDVFTPGAALASTLGAKLTPVSDAKLKKRLGYRYDRLKRELDTQRRKVINDYNSGVYGAKSSKEAKDRKKEELDRIRQERKELAKLQSWLNL
jgi:hypothetical protein